MNFAFRKGLIWLVITVCIFATFRWLFGLAMPDAALSFASGITVIILGGLFTGSSVSKIWADVDQRHQRTLLVLLPILILSSFVGMAMLVNRMIENTEFFHFSITILLLFFLSACSSALFNVIRNRIRVKIRAVQTAMVHSKSELQVLQSQLSPHFLFNTLNNMYGLSLTDPARVPALLLKLSDLLRYSIYETKELFVPIQHEVDYLNNYIEFEKVRLGERLLLKSNLQTFQNDETRIAPMLLIVFIENAFKHSKNSFEENISIDIDLQCNPNSIILAVRNSVSAREGASSLNKKHSGFGLDSVRKRLALLYTGKHELQIHQSDTLFSVHLTLSTLK